VTDFEYRRIMAENGAFGESPFDKRDCVIQVVNLINGGRSAFDGQFVVSYDPSHPGVEPGTGRPMLCHLVTTPNVDEATRFTKIEAMELWRSVDTRNPVRPDGRPNRPFTAFSVEIGPPDEKMAQLIRDLPPL
jgi:hypothetical protein